jgi:hypothetical protein
MHIAYSAIQHEEHHTAQHSLITGDDTCQHEPLLRYLGYQAACQKLDNEIVAIQKYIPGWMPVFR